MRQHDPKIQTSNSCDPSMGRWGDRPGDLWRCGDANAESCPHGPTLAGRCCRDGSPSHTCYPRRRWVGFRRRVNTLVLLLGTGLLLLALGGYWRIDFFAPGPLSISHAQLLEGELRNERCAACHEIAGDSWGKWFGLGGESHKGLTQNDLCMNCHHQRIPTQRAGFAHNLSLEELRTLSRLSEERAYPSFSLAATTVAFDQSSQTNIQNLDCSNCHREHGGSLHDLTSMSSAACQACHQVKYTSFSDDHPDWSSWPSNAAGAIRFDHKSHLIHFAKKETDFQCRQCHASTAQSPLAGVSPLSTTDLTRTPDFQTGCASCHDGPLQIQASEGFVLLQLPVLDPLAFDSMGKTLPFSWPESIQGAEPFNLTPLMTWLLENNTSASDAISVLKSPNYKPWAEEPTTQQNDAVVQIASDLHELLVHLKKTATLERTSESPETSIPSLFDIVPGQRLQDAIQYWLTSDFNAPQTERQSAVSNEKTNSFREQTSNNAPGWYRDDIQFSIGYRGTGHADVTLKSLCELATDQDTPQPLREALIGLPPVAGCLQCHQPSEASKQIAWKSEPEFDSALSLTKFSHTPHLSIQSLSDCQYCHSMNPPGTANNSSAFTTTQELLDSHPSDFGIAAKHTCASCHRPDAAGDSCTQCHRYHALFPKKEWQLIQSETSSQQIEEARREKTSAKSALK